MKKYLNNSKLVLIGVVAVFVVSLAFVAIASFDKEVSACVNNKTGSVRILNFLGGQCTKTETALVWNKQGIQGEQGLPATHGAGNIAFFSTGAPSGLVESDCCVLFVLTLDGLVYQYKNATWVAVPVFNPPIPVGRIINWEVNDFLDSDGNIWRVYPSGWININQP